MNRYLPLLLLAVACASNEPSPAATTAPSPTPVVTTPATSAPPTATTPPDPRYFRAPSDNIGCEITPTSAACDIRQKTWTTPPKPSTCEYDWGFGVYLTLRPTPTSAVSCTSDTAFDTRAPVLAYGATATAGTVTCESRTDGVRCTDSASGKGFFLSRDRYELY